MVDLLCEETIHEQESFRTCTEDEALTDTVSTAQHLQQDVHSSLPLFHKVLYREAEKRVSLLEEPYQEFGMGWVGKNELLTGDLKCLQASWCLINNNKEITKKKKDFVLTLVCIDKENNTIRIKTQKKLNSPQ